MFPLITVNFGSMLILGLPCEVDLLIVGQHFYLSHGESIRSSDNELVASHQDQDWEEQIECLAKTLILSCLFHKPKKFVKTIRIQMDYLME